jgi:membrane-bound lytic murein transglycosylase A
MARLSKTGNFQHRYGIPQLAATAWLAAALAFLLAACEPEQPKPPVQPPPEQAILTPTGFDQLPGWQMDKHSQALPALLRSCGRFLKMPPTKPLGARIPGATASDIQPACRAAQALPPNHDLAARAFFEEWFQPWAVSNNDKAEGLFTGYFEIELQGSVTPDETYNVPVYRKPPEAPLRPTRPIMSPSTASPPIM